MINYRVQYVHLETGYTITQVFPTIERAIEAVSDLMIEATYKFRITITPKYNQ